MLTRKRFCSGWNIRATQTVSKDVIYLHKPWQNAEGYTDNTAYQGTKDIIRAESAAERKNRLIIQIFRLVCELAGFEIVGRVTLNEKKSGREFK